MIAYFDCSLGISGAMTLAALIDLGVSSQWLQNELEKMPLSGFRLHCENKHQSLVNAQYVVLTQSGAQSDRQFDQICDLIDKSHYSNWVKKHSLAIFTCLSKAKNRIHGNQTAGDLAINIYDTEVIAKIVGIVLGLEYLGVDKIWASELSLGSGIRQRRHGIFPIPSPMVLEILKGWPIKGSYSKDYDMVTPIGAAIIKTLCQYKPVMPTLTLTGIGYGAGRQCSETQSSYNLLRVILGTAIEGQNKITEDDLLVIEACIDDMSPEIFGYLMELLFDDGALDVVWLPVFMKKNRPGTKMEVLCRRTEKDKLINRILTESTSLGVRFYEVKRQVLSRRKIKVNSPWGLIQAKEVININGDKRIVPEYEVCRRLAKDHDIPLRYIYEKIVRELN